MCEVGPAAGMDQEGFLLTQFSDAIAGQALELLAPVSLVVHVLLLVSNLFKRPQSFRAARF